jgi:hypothetical protein
LDRETFFKGETFQEFLASAGEVRARFEQLLEESALTGEQTVQARSLPGGLHVLVIGEPWSGDVLYFLPPLVQLAAVAGWEVRIFHRDQHPDMILPYRKDGLYHSIPVFVFYDQNFNELGNWIERPAEATRVIDEESLKLRRRLREELKAEWRAETIKELIHLTRPS